MLYTEIQWIGPSRGEAARSFHGINAEKPETWKVSSREVFQGRGDSI